MTSTQQKSRYTDDVAELLYGNSLAGIVVSLVVSCILVFGFSEDSTNKQKQIWLSVMISCLVIRYIDYTLWKNAKGSASYSSAIFIRRFSIGCIATSTIWSVYTVVFFSRMGLLEFASTATIVAGMSGGAATVLAAHRLTAITYGLIMVVPVSTCALLADDAHRQLFGMLGIALALVMALSANKAAKFTAAAIELKHNNADLLAQMEVEKRAVKEANANLERKVKERTEEIFRLSYKDPLTGLPNRKAFSSQLNQMINGRESKESSVAILFIDLDEFKAINDLRGHKIGDSVLKVSAGRILEFAGSEKYVCRWGGDEFLLALPDTNEDTALTLSHRLIEALTQIIEVQHQFMSIGATIGIAIYPQHGDNEDQLIRIADSAMYMQKQQAKNGARVFSQDMVEKIERQKYLRESLNHAIDKKQLFLVYQPIIDRKSLRTIAVEALLRWKLDEELVPPDEFIPIAERFGLIKDIGRWVMEQAFFDIKRLDDVQPINISVNVSVAQVMDDNFEKIARNALDKSELEANRVSLEITESLFAENTGHFQERIKSIKNMGVKVSIDDFGTGYSSLALLQILNIDQVKIDRTFIESMNNGGDTIIQATADIARSFHYQVVAEGVETENHAARLNAMGIHLLQGFHFSRPLKYEQLGDWLKAKTNITAVK